MYKENNNIYLHIGVNFIHNLFHLLLAFHNNLILVVYYHH